MASVQDHGAHKTRWTVTKFNDPDGTLGPRIKQMLKSGLTLVQICTLFKPYDELSFEGNLLQNEGINELWKLAASTGATKWDSSNAYVGVGTDATAAQATDGGLLGTVKYVLVDSVTVTNQSCAWVATFASADANFAWNEITVSNTNSNSGKNLNRKVQDMGTKASATVWVATLTITLS